MESEILIFAYFILNSHSIAEGIKRILMANQT